MDENSHREAFEQYASSISELDSVKKVILFGSVARGDHGVNSDVDVMIKVDNMSESEVIEEEAFKVTAKTGIPITPIITSGEDEDQFTETVKNEGVEYVRS